MSTKIKRCLYIGLGGTGMSSLLNAKKLFIETYGEVPPVIGFVGIDTDGGAYKKEIDSKYGKVRLEPYEQVSIQVKDPRSFYEVNKEHFSWLPEKNIFALQSMMLGAGQVRTNGRFAITYNYQKLENQLRNVIDRISNAKYAVTEKYELAASEIEFHMVFSVCGGTGCGTFLDMAYLVRSVAPNRKLTGYAVLPDVFESMGNGNASMARVKPNAYGAVQDLDWLMHLSMSSKPISLDYISVPEIETNQNPFNVVYFVDNKNSNGDVYNHVDQLTDMISLALVTSAGELSSAAASVSDNLEKMISAGSMDVDGKRAWCAGLGVCELLFQGSELKNLYSYKAVQRLIERMFNSCVDTTAIANDWIDSDEVKIRENGGDEHNDVIDYLLSLEAPYQISDIDDKTSPAAEVNDYINGSGMKGAEQIEERLKQLKERVSDQLSKLMIKTINQECGVGAAENVIYSIQSQVNIFLEEMNNEYKELNDKMPTYKSALDNAMHDLSEYNGRFFKKNSTLMEYVEEVLNSTRTLVCCKRDQLRHSNAISFFTSLRVQLESELTRIQSIKNILSNVNNECRDAISRLQNQVNKESQIFQIDLAKDFFPQVVVDDEDLLIEDLLKEMDGDKFYALSNWRSDEILNFFTNYAGKLKKARIWENTTIDEILDKMDDTAFNQMIKVAINKSKPLIQYNDRGHRPSVSPTDAYYIGVPDKVNSRLFKDDFFKNKIEEQTATVDFANIGNSDRVIIYRQYGVFPAFHIGSLASYKQKYELSNVSCHFDQNFRTRMQREDYSLEPKARAEDSLSIWILGFVYGLIKNEEGKYYYKNPKEGDALDDYWVELSQYRDEAYNEFKKHLEIVRDYYESATDNERKKRGAEYVENLRQDVKQNYLVKYSQIMMDRDELKKKGFEPIRKLITDELEFINKEL
ncbi:MAG: tubulin-like doman-containing protein [Bacteroidales bacterium]|nr:tubulin-like doman-containing protein [Bacteroidales bacterium]